MDPYYKEKYFRAPIVLEDNDDYTEKLIVYGNEYIEARTYHQAWMRGSC